jgi:hypothetical protein
MFILDFFTARVVTAVNVSLLVAIVLKQIFPRDIPVTKAEQCTTCSLGRWKHQTILGTQVVTLLFVTAALRLLWSTRVPT